MSPIYDGWTPPVNRRCMRCGERVFSQIYALCDDCRADDKLGEQNEDADRESTIRDARGGF